MSRDTLRKLGLLGSLYVAQGLPYGFFVQALPVLLRTRGFTLPEIGLANLLALPWALKFLAAPFVDRISAPRFGRRRAWIIPLQLGTVIAILALALLDSEGALPWLLAGVLVVNAFSALQDIGTDGLAVELLDERERGVGNGVQVAGYRVGMILGGGALLVIASWVQWRGSFLVMAALLAATSVPILLYRERASAATLPTAARVRASGFWRDFASWAARPSGLGWLGLLVAFKFGDALAQAMLRPMLVDQGFGEAQLGWMLGGVGFTTGLLGALAGGAWVNRFSRRGGLVFFGALQTVSILGYMWIATEVPLPWVVVACAVEHFTGGMATAALFTRMMDASRLERAATDYTVQASLVVIATGGASALSGFTAAALGYAGHFALGAALSGLAVLYAWAYSYRLFHKEEVACPSPSTQAPSIP